MKRPENAGQLIGGYATESLTRSEMDRLAEAALRDQALFERLIEEEDLREALSDELFKARLRARVRERLANQGVPALERLRRFFARPYWLPVGALAATLVVTILVREGVLRRDHPLAQVALGPAGIPALNMSGLVETASDAAAGLARRANEISRLPDSDGSLALDRSGNRPEYRVGEEQRLGFRIVRPAAVLILEELPDGSELRLYPNRYQSSADVEPGKTILIPPAGQGNVVVDGPRGLRKIRMLVFPPGTDVLNGDLNNLRNSGKISEREFEVLP